MTNFGTAALVALVLALALGLAITGFASAADSLVSSRPAAAASGGDADHEKSPESVDADKEFRRLGGLGREIMADALRERDKLEQTAKAHDAFVELSRIVRAQDPADRRAQAEVKRPRGVRPSFIAKFASR